MSSLIIKQIRESTQHFEQQAGLRGAGCTLPKDLPTEGDKYLQVAKVLVRVTQSCPTLCNPMDCSPTVSSVYGALQARILEWVAMPSSRGSSHPRDSTWVSHIAGRFFTI